MPSKNRSYTCYISHRCVNIRTIKVTGRCWRDVNQHNWLQPGKKVSSGQTSVAAQQTEQRGSCMGKLALRKVGRFCPSSAQQPHKLKRLSKSEKDQLLASGITRKQDTALAMKCDLKLPLYQLRKLRCSLSSLGVRLGSETQMRHQIAKDLPLSCSRG